MLSQRVGVLLELGLHLEHHPVLVQLGEHGRHLALAEGVVERVVDDLAGDAEPGRGVAVDVDARAAGAAVCWSLATSRSSGRVRSFSRTRGAQAFSSSRFASCSVYWYCVREARPPMRTSCTDCRKSWMPGDLRELGPQLGDDLVRASALRSSLRLQLDER